MSSPRAGRNSKTPELYAMHRGKSSQCSPSRFRPSGANLRQDLTLRL